MVISVTVAIKKLICSKPQYPETEILITINANRQLVINPSIVMADPASHGGDWPQKNPDRENP